MRFNNSNGEYPMPILRPEAPESDYVASDIVFDTAIDTEGSPHKITIKCELKQKNLEKLISTKKASISLAVHCDDTYYYELIDLADKKEQAVTLDERLVFGNVYFTLIVKAVKPVPGFRPKNLAPGFDGLAFDLRKGDILAISDEHRYHYRLPPVRLGANIFQLEEKPELNELEFEVALNEQKIKIGAGVKLNKLIQENMSTSRGRIKNICSIYHPALIEVLYRVKSEDFDGQAWYEAIRAAMTGVGVDIEDKSSWEASNVAQALLHHPYQALLASGEVL